MTHPKTGYPKGSQGRGRYSFHKYAATATWLTRRQSENARITIDSSRIKTYKVELIDDKEQHSSILSNGSGTSVFLTGITSEKSQKSLILKISWRSFQMNLVGS